MTELSEAERKALTLYIGECWHSAWLATGNGWNDGLKDREYCCNCSKVVWSAKEKESARRTFTTEDDMLALYRKLFDEKRWHKFTVFAKTRFSFNDYDQVHTNIETGFYAWLFCLNCPEQIPERCKMVARFYGWKQ